MATVNDRQTVDKIIAGHGVYPGDEGFPPVVRIVQYNNQWNGAIAYGLIYQGEDPLRYHKSLACINPTIIWDRSNA